ncbi:hypothetical protein [Acinetobacter phage vB_Ab4_Hep4-M]|nr:hypothetical protein [Acinetobacter phage vB_Ab4_Hep4-M]
MRNGTHLQKAFEYNKQAVINGLGDSCVVMNPPVGKIWEVKALQESSTGKALRLPKVVRVREDKDEPDA